MTATTETLYGKLKHFFGYDRFKGNQEEIIKSLLEGNDVFVLMPTGGGKSLCYQLPALLMPGTAIVISPLIALMKNQVDAIRGFSNSGERIAHFLNSSLSKTQMSEVKDDVLKGVTKLLYVAPESLTKEENIQFLKQVQISFYAIDEAHCISEWGHDFRPEYRRIKQITCEIGTAPIIALTATATPKVQSDIQRTLGMTEAKVFKSSFNRPNLYYEIRSKANPKKDIVRYIRENPGKSGIIYCLSRKKVEEISEFLNINGIKALPYHAGMDAATRARNQDAFLVEEVNVIVATIAFGMGIDKPDVRFVIHYDIPKSLEGYYQETGRAGRDGQEGRCIAFYSYKDIQKLEKFVQGKPVSEQEISRQLLSETMAYAESGQCRRKILLNYFGEDYVPENCGCCDNCTNPRKEFDGQEYLCTVLKLVTSLNENFKPEHLTNILIGENTAMVKSYKHNKHPLFGSGKDRSAAFWTAVIRQGIVLHLLEKDIERYGLVLPTEAGREFLQNPVKTMIYEDREFNVEEEADDDEAAVNNAIRHSGGCGGGDEVLLAMLKNIRKDQARRLNLPAWVIFQDPSLTDMAIQYPITLDELLRCQGVGDGKARKYGREYIETIARYVEENEIERPDDLVVRSVANRSAARVMIIQSIDRKLPFEDIASARDLSMDELLDTIEAIVGNGTALNIDYHIRQIVDPDIAEEIYTYFKEEAATDSVEDAMKALGPDYTMEEIRLIRIKFLSENGN